MSKSKKSLFELLCKSSFEDVKDLVYKDGKTKSSCPIRFLSDDEIEERKESDNNGV